MGNLEFCADCTNPWRRFNQDEYQKWTEEEKRLDRQYSDRTDEIYRPPPQVTGEEFIPPTAIPPVLSPITAHLTKTNPISPVTHPPVDDDEFVEEIVEILQLKENCRLVLMDGDFA